MLLAVVFNARAMPSAEEVFYGSQLGAAEEEWSDEEEEPEPSARVPKKSW